MRQEKGIMKSRGKNLIVLFVSCGVLFLVFSMQTMAANSVSWDELQGDNESIVVQDLNADGILSADDLTSFKTALLIENVESKYDITGDDSVDVCDLVRLKKIVSSEQLIGVPESTDNEQWNNWY